MNLLKASECGVLRWSVFLPSPPAPVLGVVLSSVIALGGASQLAASAAQAVRERSSVTPLCFHARRVWSPCKSVPGGFDKLNRPVTSSRAGHPRLVGDSPPGSPVAIKGDARGANTKSRVRAALPNHGSERKILTVFDDPLLRRVGTQLFRRKPRFPVSLILPTQVRLRRFGSRLVCSLPRSKIAEPQDRSRKDTSRNRLDLRQRFSLQVVELNRKTPALVSN